MRVSQLSPLSIPAQDIPRAVRFYREVFDLPSVFGKHESAHLSLHGEGITFIENAASINVQVIVKDTPTDIQNHFINYFVPETRPAEVIDQATHFFIADFEGNTIEVIAK